MVSPPAAPSRCPISASARPIPLLPIADNHHARCVRWQETFAAPEPDLPTAGNTAADSVLQAESLSRFYRMRHGTVRALDAMDLEAHRGEVLAVVGESGSGKSTFARVLAGLDTASGGALRFNGEDIANRPVDRRRAEQVAAIQMVFQNPDGTLNPSFSAGWPIARALRKFRLGRGRTEIESRVNELLRLVRLPPSVRHALPRQLSGGQKQRVAIARAFAGRPDLLIADEPTSALDVSVQAAVVNLLLRIQAENQATMLFISHDLGLVRYIADHVVVLYLGQVMECGPTRALYAPPFHPYTEALLSAMPSVDPAEERQRIVLSGELPSRFNPPKGCRFATRCPRKVGAICDRETPPMRHTTEGHMIFCHIPLADLRTAQSPAPAPP